MVVREFRRGEVRFVPNYFRELRYVNKRAVRVSLM